MNRPILTEETQALLVALLKHTFGSNVKMIKVQIGNHRVDYFVLLLSLRSPSVEIVVKLAGPQAPYYYPFDRSAYLNNLVASHTSITMPQIVGVDVSYREWPWRYLIKTYIPGQEWAKVRSQLMSDELTHAYQQLGNAVAQLHSIDFTAFGEITENGAVISASDYATALIARASQTIRSKHLSTLFLAFLETKRELFSNVHRACLCHEDLHGYNIIFQQVQSHWQLATILDFDKAWAGHQEIDLARMELWDGMTQADFWLDYKALRSVDELYLQRRPIYQLLWCLEYAVQSSGHLVDTQKLCKELGFPLVERFG